jgi:hypothetical protein
VPRSVDVFNMGGLKRLYGFRDVARGRFGSANGCSTEFIPDRSVGSEGDDGRLSRATAPLVASRCRPKSTETNCLSHFQNKEAEAGQRPPLGEADAPKFGYAFAG